ncbi:MAG TPA: hypothetical protein VKQ72_09625, partial [Aggregatilineales bacterium]|nr:hypothetical protein [Aggregatilineales bacterium]
YDTGVSISSKSGNFVCRWSDLLGYNFAFSPGLVTVLYRQTKPGLKLYRKDGKSVFLHDSIDGFDTFVAQLRYAAGKTLREAAEMRLRQREVLQFGPLKISLTTLSFMRKTINCADVVEYRENFSGRLHIYVAGKGTKLSRFASINLRRVMNGDVLLHLIKQLVEGNRQRPQPTPSEEKSKTILALLDKDGGI